MNIPAYLLRNDTAHRPLRDSTVEGSVSCGFLHKPNARYSDKNCLFRHYGAFLLLSGSGVYRDEAGKETPLYPGAYVQRLPDVLHTTMVESTGDWLEFFICFGRELYEALLHLNLLTQSPVLYPGISQESLSKCLFLLHAFKTMPETHLPQLCTYTQNFAMDMHAAAKYQNVESSCRKKMNEARELLGQVRPDLLSPRQAAEMLDMSYESFRKQFRQVFGISPSAYQQNSRISYSKMLLLDTEKSLNEIALLCSFADAFTFSKAFKNKCGQSPKEFRKSI